MTIGEVAERTGLTANTLRYYERIGVLPAVPRKSNGIRDYDENCQKWIELILVLKDSGMSLDNIIKYVQLARMGQKTAQIRWQLLLKTRREMREKFIALQNTMKKADYQIENYEQQLLPETNSLVEKLTIQQSCAV